MVKDLQMTFRFNGLLCLLKFGENSVWTHPWNWRRYLFDWEMQKTFIRLWYWQIGIGSCARICTNKTALLRLHRTVLRTYYRPYYNDNKLKDHHDFERIFNSNNLLIGDNMIRSPTRLIQIQAPWLLLKNSWCKNSITLSIEPRISCPALHLRPRSQLVNKQPNIMWHKR